MSEVIINKKPTNERGSSNEFEKAGEMPERNHYLFLSTTSFLLPVTSRYVPRHLLIMIYAVALCLTFLTEKSYRNGDTDSVHPALWPRDP